MLLIKNKNQIWWEKISLNILKSQLFCKKSPNFVLFDILVVAVTMQFMYTNNTATSKWGHDMLVLQACTVKILDRIMHCSLINLNLNRLRYLLTGPQLVMRRILTATCLLESKYWKYWQTEATFWRKLNEWQYMSFFFWFFFY